MTLTEAMQARHTVRKYTSAPLPAELISKLNDRIKENNQKHGVSIKLITGDEAVLGPLIKLILAKGVKNYFLLAGSDTPELGERLGYSSADLMLYAQTLGLNTWWVGGTYSRKSAAEKAEDNKVIGIVAVGYGVEQGKPHKSKAPEEVISYEGEAPGWFREGAKAALLAPTALNKQAFFIKGHDGKVSITCDNGIFTGADLGLVKYHFELGAGIDNFEWE